MILRQPISTTHSPDPFLRGLKKVLAKRVAWDQPLPKDKSEFLKRLPAHNQAHDCSQPIALPESQSLVSESQPLRAVRSNRAITAQLRSADGQVILQASNQMSFNRSLHAELLLIQTYLQLGHSAFPPGGCLEISLKPCQMCAGLIRSVLPSEQPFTILFHQADTGPLSRNTALDNNLPALIKFALMPFDK